MPGMRGYMIDEKDLVVGAHVRSKPGAAFPWEVEITGVDMAVRKVTFYVVSGGYGGVRSGQEDIDWLCTHGDLVSAPQGFYTMTTAHPGTITILAPAHVWQAGDACTRGPEALLATEATAGVTYGHRGTVMTIFYYGSDIYARVAWQGVSGVLDYLVNRPDGGCRILPVSGAQPSQAKPAQPKPLTWDVGAHVERKYGDVEMDRVLSDTRGEIIWTGFVGDGAPCVMVRWEDGRELKYVRFQQYLRLVSGPVSAAGCTRCAKPFPYEPPPMGVCAECRIVEAML